MIITKLLFFDCEAVLSIKMNTDYLFRNFKTVSPLNQPVSTERNIPISSDSVFQVTPHEFHNENTEKIYFHQTRFVAVFPQRFYTDCWSALDGRPLIYFIRTIMCV